MAASAGDALAVLGTALITGKAAPYAWGVAVAAAFGAVDLAQQALHLEWLQWGGPAAVVFVGLALLFERVGKPLMDRLERRDQVQLEIERERSASALAFKESADSIRIAAEAQRATARVQDKITDRLEGTLRVASGIVAASPHPVTVITPPASAPQRRHNQHEETRP